MARKGRFLETMAALVACGSSIKDAAAAAGASQRQGYRVSSSEEFRRRVATIRSEATSAAVGRLSDRAVRAVDVLDALLDSDDESTRLAAAKTMLSLLPKVAEHGELRARVDAIENR